MAITVHVLDAAGYKKSYSLADAAPAIKRADTTVWIDADEHTDELECFLRDVLQIHPLTVEDVFTDRLTPKLEDYGDYLYIVMHGVRRDAQSLESLGTIELDILLGKHWVFTHHLLPMRSIEGLAEDLGRNPKSHHEPAFLVHGLIDLLTEHYLPVVDRFEDEIDDIEKTVVLKPSPQLLQRLFGMKRSLQQLRRISAYQRDLLARLSRQESALIPARAAPFFRDVYDHFVRIADLADSYRELVTVSLEIYMSVVANRTNDVMKALAIVSTIMLPLTFIAGIYGMNFEHMPELQFMYGYPMALGIMGATALLCLFLFKRKGWL
jgi:magnesium transporter